MYELLLVLACLLAVYMFLIPRMRPEDRRFKSGRRPMGSFADLARAGSADDAAGWVTTLVGLMALASIMPASDGTVASTGAVVGAMCGFLSVSAGLTKVRDWILSGIGLLAAFAGVAQLLAGNDCGAALPYRLWMVGITLAAFAVGLLISVLKFSLSAKVGLQAFVLIELITFLVAPLGSDLIGGSVLIAIGAAVVLGFLSGAAPTAVFSLLGIGLAVIMLWGSTQTSDGCSLNGDMGQVTTLITGMVTFFISTAVLRFIRR